MIIRKIKPLATIFALLFLSATFAPNSLALESTSVLFLAYDQGETNAFIQIQKQLDKLGIPYRIFAMGQAAEVYKNHPARITIEPLLSLHPSLRTDRSQPLSNDQIRIITENISSEIVYTGMASRAQAQLTNAFTKTSQKLIAFYDNFDTVTDKEYVQPFLKELVRIDEFHIPSNTTAESFKSLETSKQAKLRVTGQPALETWDKIFADTDTFKLRNELNIPDNKPVVLFAGGYDGSYPESFKLFLSATREMPDIQFLITHHPKYSGTLEQQLIESLARNNVRLIHKNSWKTPELSTIASMVVVHQSTIAQQALYKNKPVIYVANQSFSNFIIEKKLAPRVWNKNELISQIRSNLNNETSGKALSSLGYPDHPAENIALTLRQFLQLNKE